MKTRGINIRLSPTFPFLLSLPVRRKTAKLHNSQLKSFRTYFRCPLLSFHAFISCSLLFPFCAKTPWHTLCVCQCSPVPDLKSYHFMCYSAAICAIVSDVISKLMERCNFKFTKGVSTFNSTLVCFRTLTKYAVPWAVGRWGFLQMMDLESRVRFNFLTVQEFKGIEFK